jgi:hypothetical protein
MTLMSFSGAWGKMIHEKNLKHKIETALIGYSGAWGNRFMKKTEVENLVALSLPLRNRVSYH